MATAGNASSPGPFFRDRRAEEPPCAGTPPCPGVSTNPMLGNCRQYRTGIAGFPRIFRPRAGRHTRGSGRTDAVTKQAQQLILAQKVGE